MAAEFSGDRYQGRGQIMRLTLYHMTSHISAQSHLFLCFRFFFSLRFPPFLFPRFFPLTSWWPPTSWGTGIVLPYPPLFSEWYLPPSRPNVPLPTGPGWAGRNIPRTFPCWEVRLALFAGGPDGTFHTNWGRWAKRGGGKGLLRTWQWSHCIFTREL